MYIHYRPDMAFTVDWVLRTNYMILFTERINVLSSFVIMCVEFGGSTLSRSGDNRL